MGLITHPFGKAAVRWRSQFGRKSSRDRPFMVHVPKSRRRLPSISLPSSILIVFSYFSASASGFCSCFRRFHVLMRVTTSLLSFHFSLFITTINTTSIWWFTSCHEQDNGVDVATSLGGACSNSVLYYCPNQLEVPFISRRAGVCEKVLFLAPLY